MSDNKRLLYHIQPFICTFNNSNSNNNNSNNNDNNNENNNGNDNDNDDDNDNDNDDDCFSIFNLYWLYIYLQYICCPFRKF